MTTPNLPIPEVTTYDLRCVVIGEDDANSVTLTLLSNKTFELRIRGGDYYIDIGMNFMSATTIKDFLHDCLQEQIKG